jgi:hypothetical protein
MEKKTKNLLLIGGGVIALYLLLKPKTTTSVPRSTSTINPLPTNQPLTISNLLSSSTSLVNGISSLFGGSSSSTTTLQPIVVTPLATSNNELPTVTGPALPSIAPTIAINPALSTDQTTIDDTADDSDPYGNYYNA